MLKKVTARHFDLTPEMKTRCEAEFDSLTRFFDNIVSAEFVLSTERHRRIAELVVNVYGNTITGTGDTDEMINSIDMAVDHAKTQLRKYKGKLKDKRPDVVTTTQEKLTRPKTDVDEVDV